METSDNNNNQKTRVLYIPNTLAETWFYVSEKELLYRRMVIEAKKEIADQIKKFGGLGFDLAI